MMTSGIARVCGILPLIALFLVMTTGSAHAYIDPGSGSIIIQAIIGAVAAGLFTLKIYWHRLTGLFSRGKNDEGKTDESAGETENDVSKP